jgi:hypothetical protein
MRQLHGDRPTSPIIGEVEILRLEKNRRDEALQYARSYQMGGLAVKEREFCRVYDLCQM